MKCAACSFEEDEVGDMKKPRWEQKKFIQIDGNFSTNTIDNRPYAIRETVYLYACPVCHTLQMRDW